jgi:hypothetical protein
MLYKLTNSEKMTANNTLWGENTTHHAKEGEPVLCTDTVIHAYRSPIHAVIYNPIHANFDKPLLWEAEGEIAISDNTKVGCKTLMTLKIIDLPEISLIQRIAFAILCVKSVYRVDEKWNEWADNWLNGKDRSYASASASASAAASESASASATYAASAYAASAYAAYGYAAYTYASAAASESAASDSELNLQLIWDQAMLVN